MAAMTPQASVRSALERLEPRFVARLAALACGSPDAETLIADLSEGRFEEKWGALPAALWLRNRRLAIDAPPPEQVARGPLPNVFWIATAMLFCTTAAEWCITAWGAIAVNAVKLARKAR